MKIFFLLLILFICENAFSQNIDLGNGVFLSQAQIDQLIKELPKLEEDKTYYHWTKRNIGLRWLSQGNIDSGEVSFYNTPTGERQVYGAGIYLAESPTSSKAFGEFPVSFKIKKGTPIYDSKVVEKILGKKITHAQASILGEHIPMVRHAINDWYLTNHSLNTNEVIYGAINSPKAEFNKDKESRWNIFEVMSDLDDMAKNDGDANYLKKIVALSDYMDGTSFARAMSINPSNPWNEFEPEHFHSYMNSLVQLEKKKLPITENGKFNSKNLKENLTKIWALLSGENETSFDNIIRSEGIRAGGDETNKRFHVSEAEFKILNENPYIEIISQKDPAGGYLVEYFYPDAFHYKKLKGKISEELFAQLEKQDKNALMQNSANRQKLNKEIINELLSDLSKKYQNVKVGLDDLDTIKYMRDLISIHPFSNFNGRSIRMYMKLSFAEIGKPVPYFMMSDMDLLLSPEVQADILKSSITPHKELQQKLVKEFALAKSEKRMPDYLKAVSLDDFLANNILDIGKINLNDHSQLELIRKRDWGKLIDQVSYEGWKKLEKELLDSKTRKDAIQKIYNFNTSKAEVVSDKTKGLILKVLESEIKSDPNIGDHGIAIFKKYESFYQSQLDPSITSPQKIKDELTKKICGNLTCDISNSEEKLKGYKYLTLIENSDNNLLSYLTNGLLTSKDQKLQEMASSTYFQILEKYKNTPQLFQNLNLEKQKEFLELAQKGLHQLNTLSTDSKQLTTAFNSIEMILKNSNLQLQKEFIGLSTLKNELKDILLNRIKNEDAFRASSIVENLKTILTNEEKIQTLALLNFSDYSDRTISMSLAELMDSALKSYIDNPLAFNSLSPERQKDIINLSQKNIENFLLLDTPPTRSLALSYLKQEKILNSMNIDHQNEKFKSKELKNKIQEKVINLLKTSSESDMSYLFSDLRNISNENEILKILSTLDPKEFTKLKPISDQLSKELLNTLRIFEKNPQLLEALNKEKQTEHFKLSEKAYAKITSISDNTDNAKQILFSLEKIYKNEASVIENIKKETQNRFTNIAKSSSASDLKKNLDNLYSILNNEEKLKFVLRFDPVEYSSPNIANGHIAKLFESSLEFYSKNLDSLKSFAPEKQKEILDLIFKSTLKVIERSEDNKTIGDIYLLNKKFSKIPANNLEELKNKTQEKLLKIIYDPQNMNSFDAIDDLFNILSDEERFKVLSNLNLNELAGKKHQIEKFSKWPQLILNKYQQNTELFSTLSQEKQREILELSDSAIKKISSFNTNTKSIKEAYLQHEMIFLQAKDEVKKNVPQVSKLKSEIYEKFLNLAKGPMKNDPYIAADSLYSLLSPEERLKLIINLNPKDFAEDKVFKEKVLTWSRSIPKELEKNLNLFKNLSPEEQLDQLKSVEKLAQEHFRNFSHINEETKKLYEALYKNINPSLSNSITAPKDFEQSIKNIVSNKTCINNVLNTVIGN